nr:MAG: replication initiator protein [Microvirus sp.]
MPCYSPINAYKILGRKNKNGKDLIVFTVPSSDFSALQVPCGRCIGCRLEYSRQWAVRMMHEASLHERNVFVTATFSPVHLPGDLSLDGRCSELFLKRLRKSVGSFRYFGCGEYGDANLRPHYHYCFFGLDFDDKIRSNLPTQNDKPLYVSPTLNQAWGFGDCVIGDVTFESAAYVARYVCKKITGNVDKEWDAYGRLDRDGNPYRVEPEFVRMSRRPGIGSEWIAKYADEVIRNDGVLSKGELCKSPRFYDKRIEAQYPDLYEKIKLARLEDVKYHTPAELERKRNFTLAKRDVFSKRSV